MTEEKEDSAPAKKSKTTDVISNGEFLEKFQWVKEGKGEVHVSTADGVFMPNKLNDGKRSVVMLRNFVLASPETKFLLFVTEKREDFIMSSEAVIKHGEVK